MPAPMNIIVPVAICAVLSSMWGGWVWFMLFWMIPAFSGGPDGKNWWCPLFRGNTEEKRKVSTADYYDGADVLSNPDPNQRIIHTSDGEILVAKEDPTTGRLYLDNDKEALVGYE